MWPRCVLHRMRNRFKCARSRAMAFCAETWPLIEMVYVDATFTRMHPYDDMKTKPLTLPIHIAINNNYQYHIIDGHVTYIFLFVLLCSGGISHRTRF